MLKNQKELQEKTVEELKENLKKQYRAIMIVYLIYLAISLLICFWDEIVAFFEKHIKSYKDHSVKYHDWGDEEE
jgi:uncharacterized membrane protein